MSDLAERLADAIRASGLRARLYLDPEICICAAIRLADGRLIRGHRHSDCIHTALQTLGYESVYSGKVLEHGPDGWHEQGFITSCNRYVGREEGMQLQLAAGIESVAEGGYRGTLFSEDLC